MFFSDEVLRRFETFSWSHFTALAVLLSLAVLIFMCRGRIGAVSDLRIRRAAVVVMLGLEWTYYAWALSRGTVAGGGIHIGVCAAALYATAIALWTKWEIVFKIFFPWAVIGALFSLSAPSVLEHGFPHFRFIHYFGNHGLFLLGNLYLLFVARFTFQYRDLARSIALLFLFAGVMYPINLAFGTNYLFLRELPPAVVPYFAFLGDFWIIGFILSIIAALHILYVPFALSNRSKRTIIQGAQDGAGRRGTS